MPRLYEKLYGDRIYLSPRDVDDETAHMFAKWMNDFSNVNFMDSQMPMPFTSERRYLEETSQDPSADFYIVLIKNKEENDKIIGAISLENIDYIARSAELGVFVGESMYRGGGYDAEAVNLILEFGFRYMNLHSIYLYVYDYNKRARVAYEKFGFKNAGRLRQHKYLDGGYRDMIVMDMLRGDFEGKCSSTPTNSYIRNKK